MSKKLWTAALSAVMAFLISFSCVGCIVTGFGMAVDLWLVGVWCVVAAIFASICFVLPLGAVPGCGLALTGGILWFTGDMQLSFWALVYRLTRQYNSVYGWGVLRPQHYTAEMLEPKLYLFLCFLGAGIAVLTAWTLCRRKNTVPVVLLTLICLFSCFLTRETVPRTAFLWLFLFGFLLLLITHTTRRQDAAGGNRLTLMAAGPLAALLLLLFVMVPQSGYTGDALAKSVTDSVLRNDFVQTVFGDFIKTGTTGADVGTVRLDKAGIRELSQAEILQAEAGYTGALYLRGNSLDSYDGKTWTNSGESTQPLYWPSAEQLTPVGEVRIKTRYAHNMLYLPYYVQSMDLTDMTRGLENTKKLTDYSFTTARLTDGKFPDTEFENVNAAQYLHYTKNVAKWAEPLAAQLTADKTGVYAKAKAIGDYVRSSARYDLNTDTMPRSSKDFARWFLEESDTGYCVHFATAAAVLLQAAGIPARYVSGYLVQVQANNTTVVRAADAHAWTEYWIPGFGWTILEATPTAQNVPEQPMEPAEDMEADQRWVGIIGAVALLTAIAAVFMQRAIRLSLRRKKLHTGTPKQRILAYWQEAVRFANCLQEHPGENLLQIAEKAKFSHHEPCEADIVQFENYLQGAKQRLKHHGFFRKIFYRFALALY